MILAERAIEKNVYAQQASAKERQSCFKIKYKLMRLIKFNSGMMWLILFFLSVFSSAALGEIEVPAIFSDNAVLQRSERVRIWGRAAPQEVVTVTFAESKTTTTTGENGRWEVILDLSRAPEGPHELFVDGDNQLKFRNVVIGEVWLCSGQSNMQWALKSTSGASKEIANSSNSDLRVFRTAMKASQVPLEETKGEWVLMNPETTGKVTAVGYYFGKQVQQELQSPVGLIDNSWGGSPIEAWISPEGVSSDPVLANARDQMFRARDRFKREGELYREAFGGWLATHQRKDNGGERNASEAQADVSMDHWRKVTLPGEIDLLPLGQGGVVWLRKEVRISSIPKRPALQMKLGIINGFDDVYWNGVKIGKTQPSTPLDRRRPRTYTLPTRLLREGTNTVAIRIFSPEGKAGVIPRHVEAFAAGEKPVSLPFGAAGIADLKGEWWLKVDRFFDPLSPEALQALPKAPLEPRAFDLVGSLYHGMVAPLIPYTIKGVLWYQGEANRERGFEYRRWFPLMIEDWRTRWGQSDLPFYFCQVANWRGKEIKPAESKLAELRESQSIALSLAMTGQAVLIDAGEDFDIHPRNKSTPGERLARIALAKTYGRAIPYSGPLYRDMTKEGNSIRLHFDHVERGLRAASLPEEYRPRSLQKEVRKLILPMPGSELQGFAISGADGEWVWAKASIEGDSVVVWSDEIPDPVAVRYAWADNPACNLYNSAGLPASPFRTDRLPLMTETDPEARYGKTFLREDAPE